MEPRDNKCFACGVREKVLGNNCCADCMEIRKNAPRPVDGPDYDSTSDDDLVWSDPEDDPEWRAWYDSLDLDDD